MILNHTLCQNWQHKCTDKTAVQAQNSGQVRINKTPIHSIRAWAASVRHSGTVICAGQQCSLTYRLAYHKFSHLIMVGVFEVFPSTVKTKGAKHFLKAERDTEAWEAQCPFVCSHKRQICAVAQNWMFVQWHKNTNEQCTE